MPELIDGDTNTLWTGAGFAPWAVAIDLGDTLQLESVDIEYAAEPWAEVGVLGTEDLLEWFDLMSITNRPVPCRAIFFDFRGDGSEKTPAIQDIGWEEE